MGAAHHLFRGVLTDCEYKDGIRTVTFEGGMSVRERIVDVKNQERRVAYAVLGDLFEFHSASMQIVTAGQGCSRFVWITDYLPDDLYEKLWTLIERGLTALARELADRYDGRLARLEQTLVTTR